MSHPRPLLHFERRGGTPPQDDEELTVAGDGSFTARRTIGGRRIGRFAGQLGSATMRRLQKAVDAVAGADDLTIETPRHGATETLEVAGHTLTLGSNESPPKPWRVLIDQVRRLLVDEVVDSPAAAIELVADARTARLEHAGGAPIDVDFGSVLVNVIRVADEGGVLGRWSGRPAGSLVDDGERLVPTSQWVTAGPGWGVPLPFDHPLELAPTDMLRVTVEVPIRLDATERDGRLYLPILQAED